MSTPAGRGEGATWLVGLPLLSALVTMASHVRFLGADGTLPIGDAAGHLVNCGRWLEWLHGGAMPAEAFPPGLYAVAAVLLTRWPTADGAAFATVIFSGGMAAGLSWLGLRASGRVAGALLPLLALASPMLAASSRAILLDLPATACILWIWILAWESRGLSKPLPTLLLGPAIALGALVKYTLFLWVAPVLLACGFLLLVRSPTALAPLLLPLPALRMAQLALVARASARRDAVVDSAVVPRILGTIVVTAVLLALALAAVRFARGDRSARWRRGLGEGAWLALAALIAVGLVFPWFHHAMPAVWEKVRVEAIEVVKTSGPVEGRRYASMIVSGNWPGAWWAMQVALGVEIVAVGIGLYRRVRSKAPFELGPALPIAVTCALGTAWTIQSLPVDPRYFLPLLVGVAIVVGLAACRWRIARWTLAPILAAACLGQIASAESNGPPPALRVGVSAFNPSDIRRLGHWRFVAPPAPRTDPVADALAGLMRAVTERIHGPRCDQVVLLGPSDQDGRPIGLETRALLGLAQIAGAPECTIVQWESGEFPSRGRDAAWLAVAGVGAGVASARLGETVQNEPVFRADLSGRAIRLYPRAVDPRR